MEPTSELVGAAVHDEDIVLFRILDEKQEPTGDIVGIEIVGFLDFHRWEDLPRLPIEWRLPGCEALPLIEFLKREQTNLRRRASAPAT